MKTTIKKSLTEKQNELIAKENKTNFDFVKLANVTDKIENKTASKVYKNCIANVYIEQIVGGAKIPTFKEFIEKLPVKDNYSNWDGYKCFAKFNTKEQLKKKVERQNKNEAKK